MKLGKQLLFVPFVGKTSHERQKEGLKLIENLPLLPRLTAVLPPQGRENTQGFISSKNVGQALPDNKGRSLRLLREKVGEARMRGHILFNLINPSPALRASSPARGEEDVVRGFTLIELLVVVLIIGILAAVALPQYQLAVMKSRYAGLKHLVRAIAQAEEVYHLANGFYTEDMEKLDIKVPGSKTSSTSRGYILENTKCELPSSTSATPSVVCYILDKEQHEYLGYLERLQHSIDHVRVCRSYVKDLASISSKVCQNETGKAPFPDTQSFRFWVY